MKEPKITFQLKPGEKTNIQIQAVINYGYKEYDPIKRKNIYLPIVHYTGLKVEKPIDWDKLKKLPKDKSLQVKLELIRSQILEVFNYLSFKGEFTRQELKDEIEAKTRPEKIQPTLRVESVRLVDFIDEYILTSSTLDDKTKPAYKGLRNKLLDFEKKIGKMVHSNDVDKKLYTDFIDMMRERLIKNNGVWTIQKNFKSVLSKISKEFKIPVFKIADELDRNEKVKLEVPENIYLNMDHIKRIIATEPKTEKMKNIKFILMILLFTGCRESDVYKIIPNKTYKKGTETFKYAQYIPEKTENEVIVPILKPLQAMFDKNKGLPPTPITQQTFNKEVKDFILSCRIKDEVTMSYTDAKGKRQLLTKKFYQWVSSHTGRRSFITNLISFIPITILTKVTGHKLADKEIIFSYNKMTLLENAALFRRLLKRVTEENKEDFPVQLI